MGVVWIVYSRDYYERVLAFDNYFTSAFDILDFESLGPIQCELARKIHSYPETNPVFLHVASPACVDTLIVYFLHQQIKDYVSL